MTKSPIKHLLTMKNYYNFRTLKIGRASLLALILFLLFIIKQSTAQSIEKDSVHRLCSARFVSTQKTFICPTGALCILPDHVNATFVAVEKHQKYSWDFGDGQKGEGSPVSHLYFKPGKYKVTLTVFSPYIPYGTDGPALQVICGDSYSQEIIITDSIVPKNNTNCDINLQYSQKNNQVKVYNQNSMNKMALIGVQNYLFWSFGDGSSSTETFPTHTYSKAGKYVISLTKVSMNTRLQDTTSEACTKILSAEGTSIKIPCYFNEICRSTSKVSIVVDDTRDSNLCQKDIQYSISGNRLVADDYILQVVRPNLQVQYHWNFGDGNTSSKKQIVHHYAKPGNYEVSVTKIVFDQSEIFTHAPLLRKISKSRKASQASSNMYLDIICQTTHKFSITILPGLPSDTSLICNKKLYATSHENFIVHFSDGKLTLDAIPENPMYKSYYHFDFGDNTDTTANSMYISHKYLPGKYKVKLTHKTFYDPTAIKDSNTAVCLALTYDEELKTIIPCYYSLLCHTIQEIEINITETGKVNINMPKLPTSVISPNPIENIGSVILKNSQAPVNLNIYNNSGTLVKQILQIEEGISNFSVDDLPNGIYLYTISSQGQIIKRDKFSVIK
ncbi:MAG: PKD domain-containing protein [Cytophagales bacterium]|nr:MAG: PKD domain-containing protein [Cytophagales bacterium]